MSYNMPILDYLREVLDEHTQPLDDPRAGVIEAGWLVDMIHEVEVAYRAYGTL
jgi:hypothetical protein